MLALGSVAFANPWVLTALAALPALAWLMRVTPPAPRRTLFPAIRLLFGLRASEETPARTPLWLVILRSLLAGLVIVALAQPILNPSAALTGRGLVLLVIDDGWSAAHHWPRRQDTLLSLIDRAARAGRPVAVLPTTPPANGGPIEVHGIGTAAAARQVIHGLSPKPWPPDRDAARKALVEASLSGGVEVFWLADGLAQARRAEDAVEDAEPPVDGRAPAEPAADPRDEATRRFAEALAELGPVRLVADDVHELALFLTPETGAELAFTVQRPTAAGTRAVWVRASAARGQVLARRQAEWAAGEVSAQVTFDLPVELRNRLARVEVEHEESAGAVVLLDERWRRRPVGLVSGESSANADQPFLSSLYYVERALTPYAEVRVGTVGSLLERQQSVLVLADVGPLTGPDAARVGQWVTEGGVLARFAGPRLARSSDELLPARLRPGERTLGGAMAWAEPAKLAPFPRTSPFRGLELPEDVWIDRQVLAEPTADIGEKTWARLEDGTPLVTGSRLGSGWLVLFHTTANTEWSNLAMSGLFVEMLRTVVRLSRGAERQPTDTALPPLASLDGYGRLAGPSPAAQAMTGGQMESIVPGPRHPPGFYGAEDARRAFNLGEALAAPAPLGDLPGGIARRAFRAENERDLMPWLLLTAMALTLVELVASLGMRGLLRLGPASAAALAAVLVWPPPAEAQGDRFAMAAALETRLAYVATGNEAVDAMSELGLLGLTRVMAGRTSVEAAFPVEVDLERHELAFFPLLYWPIVREQPELSPHASANLDRYLRNGGTILFDTREPQGAAGDSGNATLQRILAALVVPPLVPVPADHVLRRSFYLMDSFPGRYEGSPVWVAQQSGDVNDGVSAIVVGAHDWAAAWALDDDGWPVAAVSSDDERQRELAFRFGINLVMYVLTGNYKADQVHLPAILERLGE